MGYALTCMLLAGLVSGCGERAPIREYTVPREAERVLTSDVIRREFPGIPMKWTVPKSWQVAENDQFSRMAWETGPRARRARITVSDLPGSAGVEPQISRWRGQIQMADAAGDPMEGTEQLSLGAADGTWVELQGPEETILGLIVPLDEKLWIVKYRSANATAEEEKPTFRGFCESLVVPESQRG